MITVNYTVTNQGNGTAQATWVDRLRLSADSTYDDGDTFLGGGVRSVDVAAGASYSMSPSITIPNVTPGNYFIVMVTDATFTVNESDETNNGSSPALAVPITITP